MKRKGQDVWYFRYRRDGKEVAVKVGSFPTKAAVRKEVDRLGLREQANTVGKPAKRVPVTFGRVVGLWLKKELSTHAVTSQNGIRSYLRQHILPRWRRIPVSEIKPKDLRDWLQLLDLNGATVRKIKAVIGAIFSFAVFEELASTNPAKAWKLKGLTSNFEPVIVPPFDTMRIIDALESPQHKMLLLLVTDEQQDDQQCEQRCDYTEEEVAQMFAKGGN